METGDPWLFSLQRPGSIPLAVAKEHDPESPEYGFLGNFIPRMPAPAVDGSYGQQPNSLVTTGLLSAVNWNFGQQQQQLEQQLTSLGTGPVPAVNWGFGQQRQQQRQFYPSAERPSASLTRRRRRRRSHFTGAVAPGLPLRPLLPGPPRLADFNFGLS